MSSVDIYTQPTPNPNALKFILTQDVILHGKVTYHKKEEIFNNPMGLALFQIQGVAQVHFYENVITVTQDGTVDWADLESQVREVVLGHIETHDMNFNQSGMTEEDRRSKLPPEIQEIETILDRTIRPGLQGDGGDLEVIEYDQDEKLVTVQYQGASGSCPSATTGTLMAIQGILRDEFDPDVEVIPL